MSLWWVKKDQLDPDQINLIEKMSFSENSLIIGPPGSGKTNVLLRRAQYVRANGSPNVMVLTFTRPLTEFVKTGCFDGEGREIFPQNLVSTLESWQRRILRDHNEELPNQAGEDIVEWRRSLACLTLSLRGRKMMQQYDVLFVDEAQDLLPEELDLIFGWGKVLCFVGDDRQRIYGNPSGLDEIRRRGDVREYSLPFHYRLAKKICRVADRILVPASGTLLFDTSQYNGPMPAEVKPHPRLPHDTQIRTMIAGLKDQVRIYGDFLDRGDRVGIVVGRRLERQNVLDALEADQELRGKAQILRAKESADDSYVPTMDPDKPVCILTVQGCKGLEFRTVHWLFCDGMNGHHGPEHYYTVVTRAKTRLDIYNSGALPATLAGAIEPEDTSLWQ